MVDCVTGLCIERHADTFTQADTRIICQIICRDVSQDKMIETLDLIEIIYEVRR